MQTHHHIPVGAQDEKCLRLDIHTGQQVQFEALEYASHDEGGFHQAKVIADTLAGSGAKWNICKFVAPL